MAVPSKGIKMTANLFVTIGFMMCVFFLVTKKL